MGFDFILQDAKIKLEWIFLGSSFNNKHSLRIIGKVALIDNHIIVDSFDSSITKMEGNPIMVIFPKGGHRIKCQGNVSHITYI